MTESTSRPARAGCAAAVLATACAVLAAPPATAHHSVGGQFDLAKTVTITGVVTKVHWINPHIYVEVTAGATGDAATVWRLEGVPVGIARKAGLSKAMLEGNGETVTVVAHPARDGTPQLGYLVKITYPDGKVFQFAADGPGG